MTTRTVVAAMLVSLAGAASAEDVEAIKADVDFDGAPERIEIDKTPFDEESGAREWRLFASDAADDAAPIHVGSGVDISIVPADPEGAFIKSDGAIWTLSPSGRVQPYNDILSSRIDYMHQGSDADLAAVRERDVQGVLADHIMTISADLQGDGSKERVVAVAGDGFMSPEDDTTPFLIRNDRGETVVTGRSIGHPFIFHHEDGFHIISSTANGYRSTLIAGKVLK